jgi:threonine dehydrogenase-like Zn-dependent dehydrogenase
LKLAKQCGIDNVINAMTEDVEQCVRDLVGKVDVVFDTVGNELSQKQALHLLKESGCLVNLVANNNVSHYSLMDLAGEKTIVTSANNRYEDYLLGLSMIESGVINAKKMITHVLPLDEIQKGFDILLDKQQNDVMKIVLIP